MPANEMLSFARSQKVMLKLFRDRLQMQGAHYYESASTLIPDWSVDAFVTLFHEHTFYRYEVERLRDENRLLKEDLAAVNLSESRDEEDFEKPQPEDGMRFMVASLEEEIEKDFPRADLNEVLIRKSEDTGDEIQR